MKKEIVFGLLVCITIHLATAQQGIFDVGLRLQHSVNLYNENGVSFQYSPVRMKPDQLYFGLHFVTSRLGSASGSSNAIKQDNYLMSVGYFLRKDKIVRPFGRINTGLFRSDYESELFDDLDQSAILLSTEFGLSIETPWRVKLISSFGYNLNTGDGTSGPGTLYPLFLQTTLAWTFER